MSAQPQTRMAHPFAHFAKGWGIARSATAVLLAAMAVTTLAQAATCEMTGIHSSEQLEYPPIARAAHMTGDVALKAHIANDGSVTSVDGISGPEMLKATATNYVASWRVNGSGNEQICPVSISFRFEGEADCDFHPSTVTMTDTQHFVVAARPIQTCDPSTTTTRVRHSILFVHWYSKPQ